MRLEDEIKQKEFKSEYAKGIVNLMYTTSWLSNQAKGFYEQFDLTHQQYNILRILRGQYPNASTVNLLKERMLDKMSDASRIVERLRMKGLLERVTSVNDRRAVDIMINEKALTLLEKIDQHMGEFESCLQNINEEEVTQLNNLLDKLRG